MKNVFGNRLKDLRAEKDITGERLGKILNVTKVAISNWESGKRTPDQVTLTKIADFFDVSTDYLLGRTNLKKYELKMDKSEIEGNQTLEYIKNVLDILNDTGQKEAIKRISELSELKRYVKEEEMELANQIIQGFPASARKTLLAAHNEDRSKEQQKLMKKDAAALLKKSLEE